MAVQLAYRICYLLMLGSGRLTARLAEDFSVLGEGRKRLGPLVIVLQMPVLACWLLVRPVSLAAFSACSALAARS